MIRGLSLSHPHLQTESEFYVIIAPQMIFLSQALYGLTHCSLVTPYDDIDLGQHRLR